MVLHDGADRKTTPLDHSPTTMDLWAVLDIRMKGLGRRWLRAHLTFLTTEEYSDCCPRRKGGRAATYVMDDKYVQGPTLLIGNLRAAPGRRQRARAPGKTNTAKRPFAGSAASAAGLSHPPATRLAALNARRVPPSASATAPFSRRTTRACGRRSRSGCVRASRHLSVATAGCAARAESETHPRGHVGVRSCRGRKVFRGGQIEGVLTLRVTVRVPDSGQDDRIRALRLMGGPD